VEDGITFDPVTVTGEKIKEDQEYEGVRIKLTGRLDTIPILVQIDIGFGDAVRDFQIKKYPMTYCGVGVSPALDLGQARCPPHKIV
jgi:hypothetical protein